MKLVKHPLPSSATIFAEAADETPVNDLAREYRKVLDKHYARQDEELLDKFIQESKHAKSL